MLLITYKIQPDYYCCRVYLALVNGVNWTKILIYHNDFIKLQSYLTWKLFVHHFCVYNQPFWEAWFLFLLLRVLFLSSLRSKLIKEISTKEMGTKLAQYYTDQELQYGSKSPSNLNLTFSVKQQAVVKRQINYVGRLEDKGCFRRAVHKSMGFNTLSLRIIILLPPHGKASSTWEFYFRTCKKQKEGQSETLAPAVCEVPLAQNNSYTKVED